MQSFAFIVEIFYSNGDEGTRSESCPEAPCAHITLLFHEQCQKQWTSFSCFPSKCRTNEALCEGIVRKVFFMEAGVTEANVTPGRINRSIQSARGTWGNPSRIFNTSRASGGILHPGLSTRVQSGLVGKHLEKSAADRPHLQGFCGGWEANAEVAGQASTCFCPTQSECQLVG